MRCQFCTECHAEIVRLCPTRQGILLEALRDRVARGELANDTHSEFEIRSGYVVYLIDKGLVGEGGRRCAKDPSTSCATKD